MGYLFMYITTAKYARRAVVVTAFALGYLMSYSSWAQSDFEMTGGDWRAAIGGTSLCGISCLDAVEATCTGDRNPAWRSETFERVRSDLGDNSNEIPSLEIHYDRSFDFIQGYAQRSPEQWCDEAFVDEQLQIGARAGIYESALKSGHSLFAEYVGVEVAGSSDNEASGTTVDAQWTEERDQVLKECNERGLQATLYHCECLADAHVDKRNEMGGDYSFEAVRGEVDVRACVNPEGVNSQAFMQCEMLHMGDDGWEQKCSCAAEKTTQSFLTEERLWDRMLGDAMLECGL